MKTTGMNHQIIGLGRLAANPVYYALACEQGTGKTWMLLADAERQFQADHIEGLLVVAPNGVHTNWVRREIPTHLSIPSIAAHYKSGASKKLVARVERVINERECDELAVLTINIDALNTKNGLNVCKRFLTRHRCMMVIDESQKIKNPTAARTKKATLLGDMAVSRRIASGTMLSNGPSDVYSQYHFLKPGLLGTRSYRAFVSQYNVILPPDHPVVMKAKERSRFGNAEPQILATDPVTGQPKTRNLDKLSALMAPYTYRVLKKDCLDLPDKIYQTHYFELSPKQRALYNQVKEELRYERPDGEIDLYTALTLGTKLRQVTSGFIMIDGQAHLIPAAENPRLAAYLALREDIEGAVITWAHYRAEIAMIVKALRAQGRTVVEYHGGIKGPEREAAIDAIQSGRATDIVMNSAGATGITLTAAETALYYSHDYVLENRQQGEDRNHRIGTKSNVLYVDLVAEDTIDERIAAALQSKALTAKVVMDALE